MPSYLYVELYNFCIILLTLVLVLLDNQGVLLVISCVLLFYYVPRLPRQQTQDKSIIVCFTKSLLHYKLTLIQ